MATVLQPSAPASAVPIAVNVAVPASAIKMEATIAMPSVPPWTPYVPLAGSVLVSFATLVGVVWSLSSQHKKMQEELQAKSDEAHRERVTETRKEVYLELVGAMGQVADLFGKLPVIDTEEDPDYADRLIPFTVAVNRTWLVGEVKTVLKARELLAQVQELFGKCQLHLPKLQEQKNRIKNCKRMSEETYSAQVMNAKKLDEDAPDLDRIGEVFSKNLKSHHDYAIAQEKYCDQHRILVNQYIVFLFPELQKILNEFQDFMSEARREMGIRDGDNTLLRDQTDEIFQRMQGSLKPLLDLTGGHTKSSQS